jgi:hypothetical protein
MEHSWRHFALLCARPATPARSDRLLKLAGLPAKKLTAARHKWRQTMPNIFNCSSSSPAQTATIYEENRHA